MKTRCNNELTSVINIVAICWGSTNPLIKAGSAGLETVSRQYPEGGMKKWFAELKYLLTRWQVKDIQKVGLTDVQYLLIFLFIFLIVCFAFSAKPQWLCCLLLYPWEEW